MLKFLLIVFLITYLVYKIGSFFFRAGVASRQFRNGDQQRYNNINVDGNAKTKKSKFKGGEYVDYEEVK